jgi:type VI protein secretion system component VasK
MIYLIIGIALLIAGLWVALRIAMANKRAAEERAEREAERADVAEMVANAQQHTAERLREVEQQHRDRQRADEQRISAGIRDHFDNDG